MSALRTYDASQVTMTVSGALIDSGFADGEFCKIEQTSDDYMMVVGSDGETTRYPTNDHSATITITLMQTSTGNSKLSALSNLGKLLANGVDIGPMMIRDRTGTSIFQAAHTWVAGPPSVSFDRGPTARAWKVQCSDLVRFDGNN